MVVNYVDLHTHTSASDGLHSPSYNVQMAKEAGLRALAITDHDSVAGVEEATQYGKQIEIKVVPGVEISTVDRNQDIHILGYYIDYMDQQLLERLKQLRQTRDSRNIMMIERLQQLGFKLSMEDVIELAGGTEEKTIGRPHIAEVMIEKGYIGSIKEAFDQYLGKSGKAYINPPRIDPIQAMKWIHDAGGTAVIAHPGLYSRDDLVNELIDAGIDGIEVYHFDHSAQDESRYLELAVKHKLIVTAGSDFHGFRKGDTQHGAIGSKKIAYYDHEENNILVALRKNNKSII